MKASTIMKASTVTSESAVRVRNRWVVIWTNYTGDCRTSSSVGQGHPKTTVSFSSTAVFKKTVAAAAGCTPAGSGLDSVTWWGARRRMHDDSAEGSLLV